MPELPEVETVRMGLAKWVAGRTIAAVEVHHPRAIRRHLPGDSHFIAMLTGRTVLDVSRRGKYLWLPLDSGDALIAHLGMSGQLLMQPATAADEKHLRVRFAFTDGAAQLRFVDQRTFGGLSVSEGGGELPDEIAHIARDPMDPLFDDAAFSARLRARHTEIKRALLDQTLISGVGNIYADEALWRARLHGARPTDKLTRPAVERLLGHVRDVLSEAIVAGGTSFDELYVDVNGDSGYFDRSLNAYGREGEPCKRCGTLMRRESFMNRSSFSCPRCQPKPTP
ncbi:bifunctional DNA-formamidopyrimidine glycosylase/DNA-(apurinic or apyrimidinic site) lyase [Actinoplanes palleronii]|uniref:Formamidopyrimidine-DNA glycosylase n=1 Tax=Actinoplanes palleronii TaxID=113570 RepID=A0ABQ4BK30_9ACTN|nr:bifunctional DNA-formamidopyrimidine glycosylase/DNA-(apurinic or apyrimidinic site) lyase [Actinoplanes palleronii]GIE71041.1 formamidopyrimidine-DNA glycosylase [Actinoplanes palleronii]